MISNKFYLIYRSKPKLNFISYYFSIFEILQENVLNESPGLKHEINFKSPKYFISGYSMPESCHLFISLHIILTLLIFGMDFNYKNIRYLT